MMETGKLQKLKTKNDYILIYRSATEQFLQLKKYSNSVNRFGDLLKPKLIQLRQHLKDRCDQLILSESIEFALKAEDLVWRTNYHDLLKYFHQNSKSAKSRDVRFLLAILQSGVGHYYTLLFRLISTRNLKLNQILPEFKLPSTILSDIHSMFEDDFDCDRINELNRNDKYLLHKLLVHLGDLNRYLGSLGQVENRNLAIKWYNAAVVLNCQDGMPFNQLGTIALQKEHELQAAFFYIRSLTSGKPFEGAENNLRALLNKCKLKQHMLLTQSNEASNQIKKCCNEFLSTVSDFWNRTEHAPTLESSIANSLNLIRQALELPITSKITSNPSYLTPSFVFEMGSILLMLNERFKVTSNLPSDSNQLLQGAATAFTLNFFFFIVSANTKFFEAIKITDDYDAKFVETETELRFFDSCSAKKQPKSSGFRLDSTWDSNPLSFENDDLNDLEETAMSTIHALEMSLDISENGSLCDESEEADNNSIDTSEDDQSQMCSQSNSLNDDKGMLLDGTFSVKKVLNLVNSDSSLPTIKVLCNWLMCNSNNIIHYFDRLESLFSTLILLFNRLLEIEAKACAYDKTYEKLKYSNVWTQKYPLSVDLALIGFNQLASYQQQHFDFNANLNHSLSEDEKGFLCIQSVLAFGYYLSNTCFQSKVKFNSFQNQFYLENLETNSNVNLNKPKMSVIGGNKRNNDTSGLLMDSNRFDSVAGNDSNSVRTATNSFNGANSNFFNNHFSIFGSISGKSEHQSIISGMANLWLDKNENQINSGNNDSKSTNLRKPKDFCSQALTSA